MYAKYGIWALIAILALAVPLIYYSDVTARWYESIIENDSPSDKYFYDTVTGEYFIDNTKELPPIRSPAGNEAVRAYFYTCGGCGDEERFLGYYEKYPAEVKEHFKDPDAYLNDLEPLTIGRLWSVDGQEWVEAPSPKSRRIQQQLEEMCSEDEALRYCPPA